MNGLTEICWYGRGGQGAVTAAKLLAEAALSEGKFIQAFPEYGPERTGAPVKSFNRISSKPIRIHSQVKNPGILIILNPTLINTINTSDGLTAAGTVIVNTKDSPEQIKQRLGAKNSKVFIVDATKISIEKLGKNIPNMPMLGALVKATGIVQLKTVIERFNEAYGNKFTKELINGNIEAIKKAYEEVTGG